MAEGETQERIRRNYGGNYERLRELKKRYDPGNLFRMNANVVPDGLKPALRALDRIDASRA